MMTSVALRWNLFDKHWVRNKPLRLIGVGLSGFGKSPGQRELWSAADGDQADEQLQHTLDDLRDRFGDSMIRRASDIHFRPNEDNRR